ncbi:MAG TPA: PPE domain-containing protein [Actinophytocola sp.]|uniref:PPE domain-containing protein n=1 Tax=Actinophytocola sp. TaxID=1872138 RepID=UPI002DDD48FA|nr:PPE domain-containing protein [Actinophytocola sp.]HEV2780723.1 PPE domain-containing protein [Actinophytocola sp.]
MTGDGARPVPTPTMNPQAHSHEALKAMTDAAQPSGAQAVADGWSAMAAGFDEAVSLFDRAMRDSEAGWTGAAADAMRAHLARVAAWSRAMGAHYQAAGTAIGTQAAAAESARSAMPPPVPYDPAEMIRQARESGNIAQLAMLPFQLYAQKRKHDAAHDEAARVVAERDRTLARAAAEIPPFEPPPRLSDGAANGSPATDSASGNGATTPSGAAPSPGFGPATAPGTFVEFGPGGSPPLGLAAPFPRGPAGTAMSDGAGPTETHAERKRPEYLVVSDTDGMFGSDELTSPPVIGEA